MLVRSYVHDSMATPPPLLVARFPRMYNRIVQDPRGPRERVLFCLTAMQSASSLHVCSSNNNVGTNERTEGGPESCNLNGPFALMNTHTRKNNIDQVNQKKAIYPPTHSNK